MEKIENWNEIEAKGMNDYKSLPAGIYKCVIIDAQEYTNVETGKDSLKVTVDIADGEFKDYFKKKYEADDRSDKKWHNDATKYFGLSETGLPFLKGFLTVIENSNNGFSWDWDEKKLKGKVVACVFSPEEYQKQDGSIGIKQKVSQFRSVDKIKEYDISQMKIKKLDGTFVNYEEYKNQEINNQMQVFSKDIVEIDDSELPF